MYSSTKKHALLLAVVVAPAKNGEKGTEGKLMISHTCKDEQLRGSILPFNTDTALWFQSRHPDGVYVAPSTSKHAQTIAHLFAHLSYVAL
jgi:hypothetical protein